MSYQDKSKTKKISFVEFQKKLLPWYLVAMVFNAWNTSAVQLVILWSTKTIQLAKNSSLEQLWSTSGLRTSSSLLSSSYHCHRSLLFSYMKTIPSQFFYQVSFILHESFSMHINYLLFHPCILYKKDYVNQRWFLYT